MTLLERPGEAERAVTATTEHFDDLPRKHSSSWDAGCGSKAHSLVGGTRLQSPTRAGSHVPEKCAEATARSGLLWHRHEVA